VRALRLGCVRDGRRGRRRPAQPREYVRWAMAANGASEADAEAGFSAMDANGNGYVTKDELVRSMVEFTAGVEEATGNEMFGPVAV
jgi:hypothetical protein